ncbi:hypothetical protein AVEN_32482-1 [Araneus ventricosus]|uniref:P-type domain-containing protein n=1 Tax=Araneus ventricosus TaxID=182803 RepID=A0A4Y2RZ75_ARAVE|nr:hypothetical protein AVEN_32482-1 [Araneus ventricosus]
MFRNGEPPSKRTRLIIFGSVAAFVVLLLVVILAVYLRPKKDELPVLNTTDRIECPGFKAEAECKAHGCEYAKVQNGPACFMKKDKFGYKVAGYASGFNSESAFLENNYLLPPFGITPYGPQIPSPMFEVRYITEDIVRIKVRCEKE